MLLALTYPIPDVAILLISFAANALMPLGGFVKSFFSANSITIITFYKQVQYGTLRKLKTSLDALFSADK
jgi:hypothetical protein